MPSPFALLPAETTGPRAGMIRVYHAASPCRFASPECCRADVSGQCRFAAVRINFMPLIFSVNNEQALFGCRRVSLFSFG